MEAFLEGKRAIITGASRGLGRSMSLSLGGAGAEIALVGRSEAKLRETQELLNASNVISQIFIADVSAESEVSALEAKVSERMGPIDILINNAGTAVRKDVTEFSVTEWQKVINTNLTSAFMMSKAFVPQMKEKGWGRVINMTSIMAHVGSEGRSAYCASKSGLLAFTKCLALELAGTGVNVVAISPGFYATDLTAPLRDDPKKNASLLGMTPLGKWGKASDIGKIALFICSEAADFMTGNDILTDGGWLAQ